MGHLEAAELDLPLLDATPQDWRKGNGVSAETINRRMTVLRKASSAKAAIDEFVPDCSIGRTNAAAQACCCGDT